MDAIERNNIANYFKDTDLLFVAYDIDEDDEDVISGDISSVNFFIKTGYMDYDFDPYILEPIIGNDFDAIAECSINIFCSLEEFTAKLKAAGIDLYTPETLNNYLKTKGSAYTFDDIKCFS